MLANISVHEPKPPTDVDSSLAFSMESGPQQPATFADSVFWVPGWNSIQATNKYQSEIGGALRGGDPGIRLVEPARAPHSQDSPSVPQAFRSDRGSWQVVPSFICLDRRN